uniref:Uncharacterized protein n=1 Tax=Ananas comosus var. bracteatus TaxID=296719 RepID=A0A6V7Q0Z3_ANACO|nr:unnamed protein product [Ananas comosus var. bracteatus]
MGGGERERERDGGEEEQQKRSEIYTYEAGWHIYAMNWSVRRDKRYRLSIASLLEQYSNRVEIVQLDDATGDIRADPALAFDHPYPPTKSMFVPDRDCLRPDLLATSADFLRIWQIHDDDGGGPDHDHDDDDGDGDGDGDDDNNNNNNGRDEDDDEDDGAAVTADNNNNSNSNSNSNSSRKHKHKQQQQQQQSSKNNHSSSNKKSGGAAGTTTVRAGRGARGAGVRRGRGFGWAAGGAAGGAEREPELGVLRAADVVRLERGGAAAGGDVVDRHDVHDLGHRAGGGGHAADRARQGGVRHRVGGVGVFASVSADGSVRVFDLRDKEHSTIIYESADPAPPTPRWCASAGTSRTRATWPPSSWTAPRSSSSTSASPPSPSSSSTATRPPSTPSPGPPTAPATSAPPATTPRPSSGTSPPWAPTTTTTTLSTLRPVRAAAVAAASTHPRLHGRGRDRAAPVVLHPARLGRHRLRQQAPDPPRLTAPSLSLIRPSRKMRFCRHREKIQGMVI